MNAVQELSTPSQILRVFVQSENAPLRLSIANVLGRAGHLVVEEAGGADVIVCDESREISETEGSHVVVVGGAAGDAAAVLPRDANAPQIDAAVRAVAAGLVVRVQRESGFGPATDETLEKLLTPREFEVLSAIGDGLSNKAIARHLEISLHTVKFHVEAILRKLDARSRAEAVAKGWKLSHEAIDL